MRCSCAVRCLVLGHACDDSSHLAVPCLLLLWLHPVNTSFAPTAAGPQGVCAHQGAADLFSFCLLSSSQDPRKYARAKELLIMDEEIRKARQLVEDEEVARAVP